MATGTNNPPPPPPPSSGDMATGQTGSSCDNPQSTSSLTVPSGMHNAGMDCLGCHKTGGIALPFTLAGTLYSNANGSAPVAGATINVTDKTGAPLKIVTADNGNFWTTNTLTFPLKVNASLCPNTVHMNGSPGVGACNSCHGSGARIHVP
jgi:hypothetical protein